MSSGIFGIRKDVCNCRSLVIASASEGEAARGAVGSGKLRRDALFTLRTFILRLCGHQSPPVSLAVTEAAAILLATCGSTLKTCTTLLLECLLALALACDDWAHAASAAQTYLTLLFARRANAQLSRNNAEAAFVHEKQKMLCICLVNILSSMLEQLPRVVFSSGISMAVLHARRLTAAMYFLGPDGVSLHLLSTLITFL